MINNGFLLHLFAASLLSLYLLILFRGMLLFCMLYISLHVFFSSSLHPGEKMHSIGLVSVMRDIMNIYHIARFQSLQGKETV